MIHWTYPASVRVGERDIGYCGFPVAIGGRLSDWRCRDKDGAESAGKNIGVLEREKEGWKERYQLDGGSEFMWIEQWCKAAII